MGWNNVETTMVKFRHLRELSTVKRGSRLPEQDAEVPGERRDGGREKPKYMHPSERLVIGCRRHAVCDT